MPTTPTKPELRYEDAAEPRTVTGWCCKACGRFWGGDEHMARYCCATSLPCPCGNRIEPRSYTVCDACRRKNEDARWEALEKTDWDGEAPLCAWRDDRYFFSADDVLSYIDDLFPDDFEGDTAAEDAERARIADGLRLTLCEPDNGPGFDMEDYLCDHLPDDDHGGHSLDTRDIDKAVNDWIEAHAPFCWRGTGKAVTPASVKAALGLAEGGAS